MVSRILDRRGSQTKLVSFKLEITKGEHAIRRHLAMRGFLIYEGREGDFYGCERVLMIGIARAKVWFGCPALALWCSASQKEETKEPQHGKEVSPAPGVEPGNLRLLLVALPFTILATCLFQAKRRGHN